jgi:hypothetical protein
MSRLTLLAKKIPCIHRFSVCSNVRIATWSVVFGLGLFLGLVPETIAIDDSYIAGYAAAVLQHEFNAAKASLAVQGGVVIVDAESLGQADPTKVTTALENIPGVVRVEIREGPVRTDARESEASRSPRGSVPCRSSLAAFLDCVPSSNIRSGAGE